MNKQATTLMGEDVIVGFTVTNKGEGRKFIAHSAGGIVEQMAAQPGTNTQTPDGHIGPMYIAVGATKVAFFAVKQGFFSNSIKALLVEYPYQAVQAVAIKREFIPKITWAFTDGVVYEFELGKRDLKKAEQAKQTLNV